MTRPASVLVGNASPDSPEDFLRRPFGFFAVLLTTTETSKPQLPNRHKSLYPNFCGFSKLL
jgi:hypothetical protein